MTAADSSADFTNVDRSALLRRVMASAARFISIVAPAGYGKSRLARAILAATGTGRVADCSTMLDAASTVRELLHALGPFARQVEERQSRIVLALPRDGSADDRWSDVLDEAIAFADSAALLCIENAELLGDRPNVVEMIDRTLRSATRRVVVCSRVPFNSPVLGRFPPNERYAIGITDLAFTDDEVRGLFLPFDVNPELIEKVVRVSRGWPIAVLTFLRHARENRIVESLSGLQDDLQTQAILDYTLTNALGQLSAPALEVLAAMALLGRLSVRDLEAIANDPASIASELDSCPFVSRHDDVWEAHPLAVVALGRMRAGGQHALVRGAEHMDDPIRASQLYLAGGKPDRAADILDTFVAPFMMDEPSPEVAAIVSSLDEHVLLRHPITWSATYMQRAYTVRSQRMLHESERSWAALTDDAPLLARFGVGLALINWRLVLGHAGDVEPIFTRLERDLANQPPDSIMPVLLKGHRELTKVRRGETVHWETLEPQWEAVFANMPMVAALTQYMIKGPLMFLSGRRDESRQALASAVELAAISHSDTVLVNATMTAAFYAWLAGEGNVFDRLIEELKRSSAANVFEGTRHFLGCAIDEHPAQTPPGFAGPVYLTFGWIIAAVRERSPEGRCSAIQAACDAAELEGQTWLTALTWAMLGLVDATVRRSAFAQALRLCAEVQYPAFRKALTELTRGRVPDAWAGLRPLAQDLSGDAIICSLAGRQLHIGTRRIDLAPREAELLLALALARAPLDRATLAALIWPDVKDANVSIVGVTVARLRRRLGDLDLIEAGGAGYALRQSVAVDLLVLEQAAKGPNPTARLPEPLEAIVSSGFLRLPQWVLTSEWLAPYVRRYEQVLHVLRAARADEAEGRNSLDEARHYRSLITVEADDD